MVGCGEGCEASDNDVVAVEGGDEVWGGVGGGDGDCGDVGGLVEEARLRMVMVREGVARRASRM